MKKYLVIILLIPAYSFSQNILWEEGFDSTDITSKGWTIINNDKSSELPEVFSSFKFANSVQLNPQEGNYFFKFSFSDANYKNYIDDWLITPKLMSIQNGDSISFWCGAIDGKYKDSLKIWISTSDSLLISFRMVDYFKVDGPAGTWHKVSYDLSEYAGKNIYFALNYTMVNGGPLGSSSDNLWIDHFILDG
ncbi:MAG: choice-of-anchor J domain-containing protein, partial [bacterium]